MRGLMILLVCSASLQQAHAQTKGAKAQDLYQQALTGYREKNLADALSAIDQSLHLNATPEAYYLSGLIYEARQEPFKAIAAYEATVQLDPEYSEAIFQKAMLYLREGNAEVALQDFNKLIGQEKFTETRGLYFQVDPAGVRQHQVVSMSNLQSQLYYFRGQAYQKLGRFREALSDFELAMTDDHPVDALISRGLLHDQMGEEALAIADLKRAIMLDSSSQLAWYNLALLDPQTDLPEELLTDTVFGPIPELLGARAMEAGDYDRAKKYYDQVLRIDPDNRAALINRGRVWLKQGHYVKARRDFERARVMDDSAHEVLYLIGNSYFLDQQYEYAVSYYDRYLAADPVNGMIWYNGAMCHLQMKRNDEACHYLEQAARLGMGQAVQMKHKYCR